MVVVFWEPHQALMVPNVCRIRALVKDGRNKKILVRGLIK